MNEQIIMRRLTSGDVPALSVIAKETFYDTFTGTCTEEDMAGFLEQYYNEKTLTEEIEQKGIEYYFAEINGEPIGYISFRDEMPSFPEIKGSSAIELKRLYVIKDFHGKGAAHIMMKFFLDHAMSQGYDVAYLGVWEYNYRAQKFYAKYGFVNSGHGHDFPIGGTPQSDIYLWKFLS